MLIKNWIPTIHVFKRIADKDIPDFAGYTEEFNPNNLHYDITHSNEELDKHSRYIIKSPLSIRKLDNNWYFKEQLEYFKEFYNSIQIK